MLSSADAVLVVGRLASGSYMFSEPVLRFIGPGTKLVHVDSDPAEVGATQPTDVGIAADPAVTLDRLAEALDAGMSGSAKEAAKGRCASLGGGQAQDGRGARPPREARLGRLSHAAVSHDGRGRVRPAARDDRHRRRGHDARRPLRLHGLRHTRQRIRGPRRRPGLGCRPPRWGSSWPTRTAPSWPWSATGAR